MMTEKRRRILDLIIRARTELDRAQDELALESPNDEMAELRKRVAVIESQLGAIEMRRGQQ